MWTRLLVIASVLLFGAATDPSPIGAARVTFSAPTRVCDRYLFGDYIIVHDEEKVAAGQPCTTIYRIAPGTAKAVVSFHCVPRHAAIVTSVTLTTVRTADFATRWTRRLIEYQLPGEAEARGVPQ